MFCGKCGSSLPAGSRFCNSCGAEQQSGREGGSRSEARTEADGTAEEKLVFVLRPTIRFILAGYVLAGLIALLCAGLIAMWPKGSFGLVLIVAAVLMIAPAWHHIKRESIMYRLTDRKIEIRYGLLSRTVRNIPLTSIQDVTATATLGQRMLGVGKIMIESASEAGKIALTNVPRPTQHAEAILNQMRRRN